MRTWTSILMAAVVAGGCASDASDVADDDPAETAGDGLLAGFEGKADGAGASAPGRTLAFHLASGAYPTSGHDDVVAYIPARYALGDRVDVIVFLHGWSNCARNVVGAVDTACTPGAGTRRSYALAAQLEASGKNAILIVPELAYDRTSGDPGALAADGAFAALLDETLAKLSPALGVSDRALGLGDLGTVVVASHSAGYQTAAAAARAGGVAIDELYLLDSLYGFEGDYDAWVTDAGDDLRATPFVRRFASVYTLGGGTLARSQAMATRAKGWFAAAPATVVDDRTTSTWTAARYAHGALFKRTGLSHDGVPRYYFGRLVTTSALPTVASP